MSGESQRAHIVVSGRVQGVYYRANTAEQARGLGLTGWVKNMPDGSVEAVAEGPRKDLDALVAWCRHGPPAATVSDVDVTWLPGSGEYRGFSVRF